METNEENGSRVVEVWSQRGAVRSRIAALVSDHVWIIWSDAVKLGLVVGVLLLIAVASSNVWLARRISALESRPQMSAEDVLSIQQAERKKVSAEMRTLDWVRSQEGK